MIVIDGLDEMKGGEDSAQELLGRLQTVSAACPSLKCIALAQEPSKPFSRPARYLHMKPEQTHGDMCHFVQQSLSSVPHFDDQKEEEKQFVVDHIVKQGEGSFIYANLIVELAKREQTHSGFASVVKNLPKTVSEAIDKTASELDLGNWDTKHILSWMLVSERPLNLTEIKVLLELDVSNGKHNRSIDDVELAVRLACGSLIHIRDGIVRFRHLTIRQHLATISRTGKSLLRAPEAHLDLACRVLLYAKLHVTKKMGPTLDPLEPSIINDLFRTHNVLKYTSWYWIIHIRESSLIQGGSLDHMVPELEHSLPDSVLLALVESSWWDIQTSAEEALALCLLGLAIRKTVLDDHSESILQCLVTIARIYQRMSKNTEAGEYYYQATKAAQRIFGNYRTFTATCATAFISCTMSVSSTSRTKVTNQREELLKIIIAHYKKLHGSNSEDTIRYSQILGELYTRIQETRLAAMLYREIYEACVERYGEFHTETTNAGKNLTTVIEQGPEAKDIVQYIKPAFEMAEKTMKATDQRRISATVRNSAHPKPLSHTPDSPSLPVSVSQRLKLKYSFA